MSDGGRFCARPRDLPRARISCRSSGWRKRARTEPAAKTPLPSTRRTRGSPASWAAAALTRATVEEIAATRARRLQGSRSASPAAQMAGDEKNQQGDLHPGRQHRGQRRAEEGHARGRGPRRTCTKVTLRAKFSSRSPTLPQSAQWAFPVAISRGVVDGAAQGEHQQEDAENLFAVAVLLRHVEGDQLTGEGEQEAEQRQDEKSQRSHGALPERRNPREVAVAVAGASFPAREPL